MRIPPLTLLCTVVFLAASPSPAAIVRYDTDLNVATNRKRFPCTGYLQVSRLRGGQGSRAHRGDADLGIADLGSPGLEQAGGVPSKHVQCKRRQAVSAAIAEKLGESWRALDPIVSEYISDVLSGAAAGGRACVRGF
jgi:hypothetical protein